MSQQGSAGNVIAAICSIFIPGLGHLVQGRLLAAFLFFLSIWSLYGIGPFLLFIPYVIAIPLHIWCVIDTARFRS